MVKLPDPIKTPKGVTYSDAPQRSPEWIALHVGRVGASRRYDWMAVGKRDGKPLKARLDLENEIAFGKAFNAPFNRYVTGAMQEGIDNEDFVRDQYSSQMGVVVEQAGAFYDDYSIASPDGLVGTDGGIEIKWLQDNNWMEVLLLGKPLEKHYYQIQDNLRMSGRKWWDYIAANGNTGRFVVIRVGRDEELIKQMAESAAQVAEIAPLATNNLFAFNTDAPAVYEGENPW